jgi:hypothetical protein
MAEKRYENKEMQKHYESTRPKEGGDKKTMSKMGGGHEEHDSEQNIHDVVAEHGPADHVEIHSHHGGHVHKQKHHDAASAHAHIDAAMPQQEPGGASAGEPMGGGAPMGGGGIPTMA